MSVGMFSAASNKFRSCSHLTDQCFPSRRRPATVRLWISAGDKRQKLEDQVVSSNKALNEAAETLQERLSSLQLTNASLSNGVRPGTSKDEEAWEKLSALWTRETARWDQERLLWDEKEKRLLDHIYQLQSLLMQLTSQTPPAVSHQTAAAPTLQPPPPLSSQDQDPPAPQTPTAVPSTPTPTTPQSAGERQAVPETQPSSQQPGRSLSVLEQASQFMPPEPQPFQPDPPEEFAPLEVAVDAGTGDRTVENVRQSMQAAFSAVDNEDILNVTFDDLNMQPAIESFSQPASDGASAQASAEPLSSNSDSPPRLSLGSDDIFWMSKLHQALLDASLFPEEEDIENWLFGESTVSAVLTFQAFNSLPETGIVDDATWEKLLGPDYKTIKAPQEPEGSPSASEASYNSFKVENGSSPSPSPSSSPSPLEPADDPAAEALRQIRSLRASSELENRKRNNYEDLTHKGRVDTLDKWPVLREGDGGKSVHYLQIALEKKGFISDVDDQRWWFFGPSTFDSVLSFQACSYLPESGVVDATTWKALLGEDATPESMTSLTNEFEDDLTDDTDSIWLLGEQRWERRRKAQ